MGQAMRHESHGQRRRAIARGIVSAIASAIAWVLALVIAPGAAHAAEGAANDRVSFTTAYLGEFLFHPGVLGGVDVRLTGTRRGGSLAGAANLGGYVHVRNHVGVMADAELGYRFTFGSGLLVEGFAGLGYLHTFAAAPVYTVEDGKAEQVVDLGRPSFMPVVSLGVGWQLASLAPYVRVESFGQYPFNDHLLPHFALLVGARFDVPGSSR